VIDTLDPNNWMGDKGYVGNDMITPIRKPAHRSLLNWENEFNTGVNKIRYQIERRLMDRSGEITLTAPRPSLGSGRRSVGRPPDRLQVRSSASMYGDCSAAVKCSKPEQPAPTMVCQPRLEPSQE
jgi:hypothetical protein